jgi:hypothetical protein
MANKLCFNPNIVSKVKQLDLKNMSSSKRVEEFNKILGDNKGAEMNLIYEKSLLLKNQNISFDKFIKGITELTPEEKLKLENKIKERITRIENTINDEELFGIIQDSVERKYKIDLPETIKIKDENGVITTVKTDEHIFKLNREINRLEDLAIGTPDSSVEKLAWGSRVVELSDIVNGLKEVETSFKGKLQLSKDRITNAFKEDTLGGIGQTIGEGLDFVFSPVLKSVKASLDISYAFREGLKVLSANPSIYIT